MIDLDSSSALDELELGAYAAPTVSHALQNSQHPLVMTTKKIPGSLVSGVPPTQVC